MKKFNKRMGRSRSGVSDIIGNLLILAITVTLFSSIMFYVANMPEPAESTFTDFEPRTSDVKKIEIEPLVYEYSIWINITHKGGQTLKDYSTAIYIFEDGSTDGRLWISDSESYDGELATIGSTWTAGETWTFNESLSSGSPESLTIMIVDTEANTIVWQNDLIGGISGIALPPVIMDRGTVPEIGTVGDSILVWVKAIDPNEDSFKITIYLDTLLNADNTALSPLELEYKPLSKRWEGTLDSARMQWDEKKILINATETKLVNPLSSESLMTIRVQESSDDDDNDDDTDDEFGEFDMHGSQGFVLYEWSDWNENKTKAEKKKVFIQDEENAVLVMITKLVINLDKVNSVDVIDPTTKASIPGITNPAGQLKFYKAISGYYIYNCTIDTSELLGNYTVLATITDLKTNPDTFRIATWMYVIEKVNDPLGYPTIETYLDSAYSKPSAQFTTYNSSTNLVFVQIKTDGAYNYVIGSGNVEIRDFLWNAQISKNPPAPFEVTSATSPKNWNGPVSNIWRVDQGAATPAGVYRFVINLANATDGTPWLGGSNSYLLRFDVFKTATTDGEQILLNTLIKIDAPKVKYDIIIGSKPSQERNSAWATGSSLFYYKNDNSWNPAERLLGSVGATMNVKLVKAADINGDGRGDALVYYYEYIGNKWYGFIKTWIALPDGGWNQFTIWNTGPMSEKDIPNLMIELGNLDLDDDLDMIVTNLGAGTVRVYMNDGAWSTTSSPLTTLSEIKGVRAADMDAPGTTNNDPLRSLDIVIAYGGNLRVYKNWAQIGLFDGTHMIQLAGGAGALTPTPLKQGAVAETTNYGSITYGSYLSTQSVLSLDYEELTEEIAIDSSSTYPTAEGSDDDIGDTVDQLGEDNDVPYTVQPTKTIHMAKWDEDELSTTRPMLSVKFVFNYTANGFVGGAGGTWIQWNNSGTWTNLVEITDTGAQYVVEESADIKALFSSAVDIGNFEVRLFNNGNTDVQFDYWKIVVVWEQKDMLEHVWEFNVAQGYGTDPRIFSVYAGTTSTTDNFRFDYSVDGINWYTMLTITNADSIDSATPRTFSITNAMVPLTYTGPIFVRVNDTDRTSTLSPVVDNIKLKSMYIQTTVGATTIGSTIQSFDTADIDGNGGIDIVACTIKGGIGAVYVINNTDAGLFAPGTIWEIVKDTRLNTNAIWIEGNKFFGDYNKFYTVTVGSEQVKRYNLDIVIGVKSSPSKVYGLVSTYSGGKLSFGTLQELDLRTSGSGGFPTTFTLVDMVAADIDGNGRCDLLLATSTNIVVYWANYRGTIPSLAGNWPGTTWLVPGWQPYIIDALVTTNSEPIVVLDIDAGPFGI